MHNLILLSWNVRGLNNLVAQRNIRNLVRETRANLVFLQESKCQSWSAEDLDKILDLKAFDCLAVNSTGLSGGLVTIWLKADLSLSFKGSSSNWFWSEGLSSDGIKFNLINVYGPHEVRDKIKLWQDLHDIVLQKHSILCDGRLQ